MSEITDREHLYQGDIWSNKNGWQTREDAARESARKMLPFYRVIWAKYVGTEISDEEMIDLFVAWKITPLDAALGR